MRKRTKKDDGPRCQFCGRTHGVGFSMTSPFGFGKCCVDCEALDDAGRENVKFAVGMIRQGDDQR